MYSRWIVTQVIAIHLMLMEIRKQKMETNHQKRNPNLEFVVIVDNTTLIMNLIYMNMLVRLIFSPKFSLLT